MTRAQEIERLAGVLHDAYCAEETRQGFPTLARWPIVAQDHADRWRAAARAALALPPVAVEAVAKCQTCEREAKFVCDVHPTWEGMGYMEDDDCVACPDPFHKMPFAPVEPTRPPAAIRASDAIGGR